MIEPNIANPRMNPPALAIENVARRNSRSGRIGSLARVSTNRNTTVRMPPATNSPMICAEPHA